jgi:hypothetical protein
VCWFCNIEKELKNKPLLVTMTTVLNMQQYSNFLSVSIDQKDIQKHTKTFSAAFKSTDSKKSYLHWNKKKVSVSFY